MVVSKYDLVDMAKKFFALVPVVRRWPAPQSRERLRRVVDDAAARRQNDAKQKRLKTTFHFKKLQNKGFQVKLNFAPTDYVVVVGVIGLIRKRQKSVDQCDQIGRFIAIWVTFEAFGNVIFGPTNFLKRC